VVSEEALIKQPESGTMNKKDIRSFFNFDTKVTTNYSARFNKKHIRSLFNFDTKVTRNYSARFNKSGTRVSEIYTKSSKV